MLKLWFRGDCHGAGRQEQGISLGRWSTCWSSVPAMVLRRLDKHCKVQVQKRPGEYCALTVEEKLVSSLKEFVHARLHLDCV